jgi:hypothetical protein
MENLFSHNTYSGLVVCQPHPMNRLIYLGKEGGVHPKRWMLAAARCAISMRCLAATTAHRRAIPFFRDTSHSILVCSSSTDGRTKVARPSTTIGIPGLNPGSRNAASPACMKSSVEKSPMSIMTMQPSLIAGTTDMRARMPHHAILG